MRQKIKTVGQPHFFIDFGSISVAYGNIPAPGREKTGTKDKVPGIVLGDFAERASKEKKEKMEFQ